MDSRVAVTQSLQSLSLLPVVRIIRKLELEEETNSNSGTAIWDEGVSSSIITTAFNTFL